MFILDLKIIKYPFIYFTAQVQKITNKLLYNTSILFMCIKNVISVKEKACFPVERSGF